MEAKEAYNANSNSYNLNQDSEQVPIKNMPELSQNSPAKTLSIDARDANRKDDTPFSDLNEKTVKHPDIDLKDIDSNRTPRMSIKGNSILPVPVSDQLDCQINNPGQRQRGLSRPESTESAKSQKPGDIKSRQAIKRPEDQSGVDTRKKQICAAATFTSKYTKVVSQVLTDRCRQGSGTIGKTFYERIQKVTADKKKTATDIDKESVDDYLFMDEPQIPLLEAFEYLQIYGIESRDGRSQLIRHDFIMPEDIYRSISVDVNHALYMTLDMAVINRSAVVNLHIMTLANMPTDNYIVCLMTVNGKLVTLEATCHVKYDRAYMFIDLRTTEHKDTSTYYVSVYDAQDDYRLVMTKDVSVLINDMRARDVDDFSLYYTYCQYTTTSIALIKTHAHESHITCMVIDVDVTITVDMVDVQVDVSGVLGYRSVARVFTTRDCRQLIACGTADHDDNRYAVIYDIKITKQEGKYVMTEKKRFDALLTGYDDTNIGIFKHLDGQPCTTNVSLAWLREGKLVTHVGGQVIDMTYDTITAITTVDVKYDAIVDDHLPRDRINIKAPDMQSCEILDFMLHDDCITAMVKHDDTTFVCIMRRSSDTSLRVISSIVTPYKKDDRDRYNVSDDG